MERPSKVHVVGRTPGLTGAALSLVLLAGGCDPTLRLAPASEGAGGANDPTLPNDPLPWVDDTGSMDTAPDTDVPVVPTEHFVVLGTGDGFTCGLTDRGRIDCWGRGDLGLTEDPEGTWSDLDAQGTWWCGVTAPAGELRCRGEDLGNRIEVPQGTFASVDVGAGGACALGLDGAVTCWAGLTLPDPGVPAASDVAVGDGFACLVGATAGTVSCFGREELTPPAGLTAVQVQAGSDHACARSAAGAITCWGEAAGGRTAPPAGAWVDMALADAVGCAVDGSGDVTCWGPGVGDRDPADSVGVDSLAIGADHGCGLQADGVVRCWGDDTRFQASTPLVGVQTFDLSHRGVGCAATKSGLQCFGGTASDPVHAVPALSGVTSLAAANRYACAVGADQAISCWGDDGSAQAGVPAGVDWSQIAVTEYGLCAVGVDGALRCWGDDFTGFTALDGPWTSLDGGFAHLVGLDGAGNLLCEGRDAGGSRCSPPPGEALVSVGAGTRVSCGVTDEDGVVCFGPDVPITNVPEDGTWSAVSAGKNHACGLRPDGSLTCWGLDDVGQASPPPGVYVDVDVDFDTSCAIRASDRALVCWGARAR